MAQLRLPVLEDLIGLVLGHCQQQILSAARTGSELPLMVAGVLTVQRRLKVHTRRVCCPGCRAYATAYRRALSMFGEGT